MLLALLLLATPFPPCTSTQAGTYWTDPAGQLWYCTGSYWTRSGDAGTLIVTQGTVPWVVSGGGSSGSNVVTVDSGTIDARVSNFPAMWPSAQVVLVDSGTVDARVTNFPATQYVTGVVTIDGGTIPVTGSFWPALQWASIDSGTVDARVTSLPAVVIDGGINISSLPAVVIDGGVSISNWPATVSATLDGGTAVALGVDPFGAQHPLLTDQFGAQYISTPRPLPLPKCNPVRRYNCQ
jgi:hypothetical protein